MSTPGRCSECAHFEPKVWSVDGSRVQLCRDCLAKQMREAEEPNLPSLTVEELMRRLRPYS